MLLLFVLLVLFIRSPWGQNLIVNKVTNYVSEEIGTPFQIDKFYLTFQGNLAIDGIYVEDQAQDTLLYSQELEIDIPILPILKNKKISLQNLKWSGLVANVNRNSPNKNFNYQYIIDAFASEDEANSKQSQAYTFDVKNIDLTNFNLSYIDDVEGLNSSLKLGNLQLAFEKFNIENLDFQLKNLYLKETKLSYFQEKSENTEEASAKASTSSETESFPIFLLNHLAFENVEIDFEDENNGLKLATKLTDFQLNEAFANLNKDEFKLEKFYLAESYVEVNIPESTSEKNEDVQNQSNFVWPAYTVELDNLEMNNNRFQFTEGEQRIKQNTFNEKAIEVTDVQLSLSDFVLTKQEQTNFNLNQFSFKESSGFELNKLAFNFNLNNQQLDLNAFAFQMPQNTINANLNLEFDEVVQWIENPQEFKNTNFNLDANLNLAELISVYPDLKQIDYMQEISKNPLKIHIKSNGNLERLSLSELNLKWASTQLKANGDFTQLNNLDQFTYQLQNFNFTSTKTDILKFVALEQASFNLPKTIYFSGYANGDLNSLKSESFLRIPEGKLKLYADLQQEDEIRLDTKIELIKMDLGTLLKQPKLKPVSLVLSADAAGKNWYSLKGQLNSSFSKLNYSDFDLSDLEFSGKIDHKNAHIHLGLNHEYLKFTTDAGVVLDSIQPKGNLKLDLEGANFQKLGLTAKDIRGKTYLKANFSGNSDKFNFNTEIDSTTLVYDNENYKIDKIELNAEVNQDQTNLSIQSGILSTQLQANAHPDEIQLALQEHLAFYTNNSKDFRETNSPVDMKLDMRFHASRFISEVALEGIEELDTIALDFEFNEEKHQLNSKLSLPKMLYNETRLDSLAFAVNTNLDQANFSFGFKNLQSGVLEIAKTKLYGELKDSRLSLNFEAFKDEKEFFNINSMFTFKEDEVEFSILPEKFILNENPWQISPDNYIRYLHGKPEKEVLLNEFEISRNQQYVGFKNNFDVDKTHAGIAFKDFKLSTLFSYLNSEEDFAKGIISGDLIVVNPFEKMGLISDLQIENLEVLENEIGKFSLNATSDFNEAYQINIDLTGKQIDFHANGNIDNSSGTPNYHLSASLDKLKMEFVEGFAKDYVSDTKGSLAGKFNLNGASEELDYNGNFSFMNTEFKVNTLNALFKIDDNKIEFDKKGLYFKDFIIKDVKDIAFTLNGDIGIADLLNPTFNLNAKSKNFQALNSTKEDNDVYYGKVNFDADISLLGDLNFPKAEGEIAVRESTDFTYIVPQSQVGTVERDGVVVFVNKKNPKDILTQQDEDQFDAVISGIEINTLLKINPKTKAKVVINPKTGDNVKLVGGGDLRYKMARNGTMSLVGKYEVSEGQFEMNLYNLVSRKFQIAEGSSIKWSGDPLNADLDIRAIYNIKTSASSLMASQTSSASSNVQNQYRQQLPFNVYLDVGGEINAPELNFKLDMPEGDKSAINGTVYSRIRQINQQQDELNKQVFSLLVLNRFYPNSGSDGSQGGAANIARSNISQALSDQLNTYANKLTGNTGIQLNFDVNSYTDYQSGQADNRTDVDISAQKKLMNDRLIVEAGSQVNVEGDLRPGESNVALGNVSVQYLITEDGRWKIKGFRRSEYENVIDGQVFISGIALIFTREFNQFKELWQTEFMKDETKEETENEAENSETNEENKTKIEEEK
ncbi:translocation/assembly module TamB domain-containing protein [Psychroflexus planctonicus]|uniref:translocation/assembly module TamB domain-containing protein n=1 Tax=Psychroflexus planctonicus TaxID=1526575 RepID=UPI0016693759|nr:translocation/assembly module TamB domain-containing protein [Psychroflexus planctonicus]